MAIPLVLLAGLIQPLVKKLIDKIPDKKAQAKAEHEIQTELMHIVETATQGQLDINKQEAAHKSIFVAGWRPFIGWVCGIGIMWAFVLQPVVVWIMKTYGDPSIEIPVINVDGLYQLVFAMLGMGGLRTFEKIKGVSREK